LERAEGSPQAWIQSPLSARRFVNQTANCETALMSGRAGDKRICLSSSDHGEWAEPTFRDRPVTFDSTSEQTSSAIVQAPLRIHLFAFMATGGRKFMSERRAHGSKRFAVFFFLASAVFPSLSRAQVPVFKITTEDSSIKFSVKASGP
jgi:hypothetical protein